MKLNKKGFTIVELVIVIAVIAILAAVLIPTFSNVIKNANQSSQLQAAKAAEIEVYAEIINDGKIDDSEKVKTSGDYTFTYDPSTTKLTKVEGKAGTDAANYTFTVTAEGVLTAATKKAN